MCVKWDKAESVSDVETSTWSCAADTGRHVVMINVSPLEYGHVLLVPHIDHSLPQVHSLVHTPGYTHMLLLFRKKNFKA